MSLLPPAKFKELCSRFLALQEERARTYGRFSSYAFAASAREQLVVYAAELTRLPSSLFKGLLAGSLAESDYTKSVAGAVVCQPRP